MSEWVNKNELWKKNTCCSFGGGNFRILERLSQTKRTKKPFRIPLTTWRYKMFGSHFKGSLLFIIWRHQYCDMCSDHALSSIMCIRSVPSCNNERKMNRKAVKEPDRSGLLDCDVRILHRLRGPRHVALSGRNWGGECVCNRCSADSCGSLL